MYRYTLIAVYASKYNSAMAQLHIFIHRILYADISLKAYILLYGCNYIYMR